MSKMAQIERQTENGQANSVIESAFTVGCLSLSIFMLLVFLCALILLICG